MNGLEAQINHTVAVLHKYAQLLGIHRNELIAVYPQKTPNTVNVLVPNLDVVESLKSRFNVKILSSDGFYLLGVEVS